jgi:hypothetical protein
MFVKVRLRTLGLLAVAFAVCAPAPAAGGPVGAVLHEPIPPDPHEDIRFNAALDGELPAAIETRDGVVSAPDPRKMPSAADAPYSNTDQDFATFTPDRNTQRPDVEGVNGSS